MERKNIYISSVKNFIALQKYFFLYKWYYVLGIIFVSLSSLFANYQAVIVRKATNEIVFNIHHHHFNHEIFLIYLFYLLALSMISGLFMFLMRQTIIVSSRHIEYEQKNDLYYHLEKMDKQFLKMQNVGDLMNKINEDVGRVRMFTGPAIMYLVNVMVTVVSVLFFMLSVSPLLTLCIFLPLPLFSWAIFQLSTRIHLLSINVQEKLSAITTFVQESVSFIRLIKVHGKEIFFEKKLQEHNQEYASQFVNLGKVESLFQPLMVLVVGTGIIIAVWMGSILLMKKELEPGNITEFVMYVYRLTWPFMALGWVSALIQRAAASQKRINELLNIQPTILNETHHSYQIIGNIEFRNAEFTYKESHIKALDNISFQVKKGEVLGICGKVGAGKSTVFQLLLRFYDTDNGAILIDGKNIKQHHLHLLRSNAAYVPQDAFLFNDSVLNNITFPEKNSNINIVIEVCKKVEIHDTIMSWPQQYHTMIGERGINVSGGQRQRLALARALIKDKPILLIDDAFSALDNETEQKIVRNIKEDIQNKTVIIVAQKLSVIQLLADKVIYLKDGKILETGAPEELINKKTEYYKLYELQMLKQHPHI